MRRSILLFLCLCALLLSGCIPIPNEQAEMTSPKTDAPTEGSLTAEETVGQTEAEAEQSLPTPETDYFPNETDDSHTKRY